MFENIFKNPEIHRLKYYILFMAVCICVYTYAGLTGWKYTGTNSEKWAPDGQSRHYHK